MKAEEIRTALVELRISQTELAHRWGISARTVRRWCDGGCDGTAAVALGLMLRLDRLGVPLLPNEVAIDIASGGQIVFLDDVEAAARHKRMLAMGATR